MTGGFARLQDEFQRAILDGDDGVLAELMDGPRAPRETLFGVYRDAYLLRLVEATAGDYERLRTFMGEDAFDGMARAYAGANPSRHRNMRWFASALPAFLATTPPFSETPWLGELAALEAALADAFDAPDAHVLAAADLADVEPARWSDLRFAAHPGARRLDCSTNALAIWSALTDGEAAPEPQILAEPQKPIVWRLDATAMVRPMPAEEAMMWDEARAGVPFGVLCAMAATFDDPDGAAARAAGYLGGWISAGMLTAATLA